MGLRARHGHAADEALLAPMMERLSHRGPDHQGSWSRNGVALGHLRLRILDLSVRGDQPMLTEDGLGVIVCNGEVYNRLQLRAELEGEGVRFRSGTDTEVVLHALHRWGPERAIPRFNGMFALAYLDLRRDALWLARDRLGIKPLYVAEVPHGMAFASEPKALLAHPDVSCRPDRVTLARHVASAMPHMELRRTAFLGIEALPPGSLWELVGDDCRKVIYFDLLRELDVERITANGGSDMEPLRREFEQALRASVGLHLASDAPLALAVSGGVDSGIVAALAHETAPGLPAYVANVSGTVAEGDRARLVTDAFGLEHRQVDLDRRSFLRLWPEATWFADQPVTIGPNLPMLALARACRRDGIRVLLSGEGSDEMFGGYPWQTTALYACRGRMRRARWRALGRMLGIPVRFLPRPYPEPGELARDPFQRYSIGPPLPLAVLDEPDERAAFERALLARLEPVRSPPERAFLARCLDDTLHFLQAMLMHSDRMCMASGVEMRVPFVENGLIDLAAHCPFRAKLRGREGKWIVRRTALRHLPSEVVRRGKQHFAVPYHVFARAISMLEGGNAAELLGWRPADLRPLLPGIRKRTQLAFRLLSVEIWGRIFLRGEAPERIADELETFAGN